MLKRKFLSQFFGINVLLDTTEPKDFPDFLRFLSRTNFLHDSLIIQSLRLTKPCASSELGIGQSLESKQNNNF